MGPYLLVDIKIIESRLEMKKLCALEDWKKIIPNDGMESTMHFIDLQPLHRGEGLNGAVKVMGNVKHPISRFFYFQIMAINGSGKGIGLQFNRV